MRGDRVKDALGDRMKHRYENRFRFSLPRRTYTIVRVDGRAFHTFTRGMERPFDKHLADAMDRTAQVLCAECQGAQLAFVQSDEISVLLTDFDKIDTEAWFDGNVQKIASIAASTATAAFDSSRWTTGPGPTFDARCFTIPDPTEVENYFIWRQQDAVRNSIAMAAQACFSPKQLHGKSAGDMQEMLFSEHGINWDGYPVGFKRGRAVLSETTTESLQYVDRRTGETRSVEGVEHRAWTVVEPPTFTQEREWLRARIPRYAP